MTDLVRDIRLSLRVLTKSPGFVLVVVIVFSLGIGASTAVFSVVHGVLFRPLPYPDAERLVQVWDTQPEVERATVSYPEYLDWREVDNVFDGLAGYTSSLVTLTGQGDPERLRALSASATLLPLLGARPALGQGFRSEDESTSGERVALISDGLWRRRFGADPQMIGRTVTLQGLSFSIIGVLPRGFRFSGAWDVLIPLRLSVKDSPRGMHFLTVLGRLRPGLDLGRARPAMDGAAARLRERNSTTHGVLLVPLRDQIVGDTRPTLLLLLGAVGFVLLIACANVASLQLARAAARRREMAVRMAMGAGRIRLACQMLTESVLLGLMGGAGGLLLAWWGVDYVPSFITESLPRAGEIGVDGRVLGFALAISLLAGFLSGVAPAIQGSAAKLNDALKEGGRLSGAVPVRSRLRSSLVVGEVALSLVLLAGAGLLIRSFVHVLGADKGFDPEGVLTLELSLTDARYREPRSQRLFIEQLMGRITALPGVEAAGLVSHLPLDGSNTDGDFRIEGRSYPRESGPKSAKRFASPDYFRVMRIPLVRGRYFTDQDAEGAHSVVIINETLAQRFFPGEDPIGKRVDFLWGTTDTQEIAGVVGDVRHEALDRPPLAEIYVPYLQRPDLGVILGVQMVIRTSIPRASLAAAVREQMSALDRDQPIPSLRTMGQVVSASVSSRRLPAWLMGGFSGLAIILAAVGLYGFLSFVVAQRRHELGVRMALGARPWDILRLVVGEGMQLTLAGVLLGLAASAAMTRLLSGLLFGVGATDPVTFAATTAILAGVALLACYVPARRATKVDPMIALRCE